MTHVFNIARPNRSYWFNRIDEIREAVSSCHDGENVEIRLDENILPASLKPWHIASLACLMEFIFQRTHAMRLCGADDTERFFTGQLHLDRYFTGVPHVDAFSPQIFNLWKIEPRSALLYSSTLAEFFKRKYFKGRDVSLLQTMLDELYANVGDHARAGGVAYSYIHFDVEAQTINVASCDFGIGIVNSLKQASLRPAYGTSYIKHATLRGVSCRSNSHNAGFGLATVVECMAGSDHYLRIMSNDELYYHLHRADEAVERTFTLNFDFRGTLIEYRIAVSQFESEEILGTGNLFDTIDW